MAAKKVFTSVEEVVAAEAECEVTIANVKRELGSRECLPRAAEAAVPP